MARVIVFLLLVLAPLAGWAEHALGKSNRLAGTSSAYLQQHARNPVDWHPWGPETIEANFPKGALSRRGVVAARLTVQACSDTVCLPPETIAVPVRADDQPALKRAISPPKAPGGKKP
jgi:hypothetical protein